ncbi:MAG: tRNA (N6-threonylcarbamoyladenosine(37)-N6)-methyltransferase TrmO [Prevotella sp.]|jgi:tRNA-Thr(GGU) m(6)t(6)A37 methyltransferase TsaA|nr:tRNA (N6-threonylcarbamoyladenosine(37)-N6)-methyltransferase TrmO [Prevotella sp.]
MQIQPIAHFVSPFPDKFGIPKQSGLVEELRGEIVFESQYRNPEALRGMEDFDFLWLIWGFSANKHAATNATVRPPLLGGNERVGVFASRSPFRPNGLGLSSVRITGLELDTPRGPIIHVAGADLMNGTPIYDIKPYVAYADSHPDVRSGFVDSHPIKRLDVEIPDDVASVFPPDDLEALRKVLALDPRPHYHDDASKVYGMFYASYNVRFMVDGNKLVVKDIKKSLSNDG